MQKDIIFHQLFEKESSTFTYIAADPDSKEGIIIDPVMETVERDFSFILEQDIKIKYILDTHVHADHVTSAGVLRQLLAAVTVVGKGAKVACADILIDDGEELSFGNYMIKALATPGHTDSCTCYLLNDMLFSGDTLLIRGNGRCDFQQGDAGMLFDSIKEKLYTLDPKTKVFPGHDYKGFLSSTIADEMKHNRRIRSETSKEEFQKIMDELSLGLPAKIHQALPENLKCGIDASNFMDAKSGIAQLSFSFIKSMSGHFRLIDIRSDEEFQAGLKINSAERLIFEEGFEQKLGKFSKEDKIIFVCKSGTRSVMAADNARKAGFKTVFSLKNGFEGLSENELKGFKG